MAYGSAFYVAMIKADSKRYIDVICLEVLLRVVTKTTERKWG